MGDARSTQLRLQWVVAALAGALVILAGVLVYLLYADHENGDEPSPLGTVSLTPGMDHIDAFTCAPGLTRIVLIRGVEDNFSRDGEEPAIPRDAVLENGYFQSLAGQHNHPEALRDYDQAGVDRFLIDHFDVPKGIISGQLVFSSRQLSSAPNDAVTLGDLDVLARSEHPYGANSFVAPVGGSAGGPDGPGQKLDGLYTIDFVEMIASERTPFDGSFLEFLNSTARPEQIDFKVSEDTMVDFAAMLLCQEPAEARGTTLREFRMKLAGPEFSYLTCREDQTQPSCNEFSGDQACAAPMPIACFNAGGVGIANPLEEGSAMAQSFVAGQVTLSDPVTGDAFRTRIDADKFCTAQFGQGWGVLSYHESGGQRVSTRSDIAPKSRGLVHVDGQPYANCWDRPESVVE